MKYSLGKYLNTKLEQANREFKEEVFRREFEKAINNGNLRGVFMKKMKRFRSAFTTEQVNYLEKEFKKYPYIGNSRRKDVSNVLDIPERAIKIWFQNRRMKEKKEVTNKELYVEEKTSRTQTVNSQLIIASDMPPINDPPSLPLITAMKESPITKNIVTTMANETRNDTDAVTVISAFFKDVSPCPDLLNVCQENNSSISSPAVINKNLKISKNTAEFSIDLLKKYKLHRGEKKMHDVVKLEKDVSKHPQKIRNVNGVFSKTDYQVSESLPISPACAIPQDLSSRKQNIPEFQQHECSKEIPIPIQPMISGMNVNNAEIPVYLKGYYTQPYIPSGNVIWKPFNVAPIMSTGVKSVNANNSVQSTLQQQNTTSPIRTCSCDCHLKHYPSPMVFQQTAPTPQVQYVLTAVPFQSPGTKFA